MPPRPAAPPTPTPAPPPLILPPPSGTATPTARELEAAGALRPVEERIASGTPEGRQAERDRAAVAAGVAPAPAPAPPPAPAEGSGAPAAAGAGAGGAGADQPATTTTGPASTRLEDVLTWAREQRSQEANQAVVDWLAESGKNRRESEALNEALTTGPSASATTLHGYIKSLRTAVDRSGIRPGGAVAQSFHEQRPLLIQEWREHNRKVYALDKASENVPTDSLGSMLNHYLSANAS